MVQVAKHPSLKFCNRTSSRSLLSRLLRHDLSLQHDLSLEWQIVSATRFVTRVTNRVKFDVLPACHSDTVCHFGVKNRTERFTWNTYCHSFVSTTIISYDQFRAEMKELLITPSYQQMGLISVSVWPHCSESGERLWKNEVEWSWKEQFRTAELLAAGEASKDVFLHNSGLTERAFEFDSSGFFSAVGPRFLRPHYPTAGEEEIEFEKKEVSWTEKAEVNMA